MDVDLSRLCGSQFWDTNLTWNTDNPSFTPCFEKTVLVWIPCLFLVVFSSIDIFLTSKSKIGDIPWNWRNLSKIGICGILIGICIYDLIYNLKKSLDGEAVYPVDTYTPFIKIIAVLLVVGLLFYHRRKGIRASGVLFLFWFLIVILGLPQFKSSIENIISDNYNGTDASYLPFYGFCVFIFILNFIADLPPKYSEYSSVDNPCPIAGASFPSKVMFIWLEKLVYLGYKQPLTQADLWSLNPEFRSSEITPLFDKYWFRTVQSNEDKSTKTMKSAAFDKNSASVDLITVEKLKPKHSSVLPALCKAFGPSFLAYSSLKLCQDLLGFVSPQILELLISFIQGDQPTWRGYFFACLMFFTASLQTLILSQYFVQMLLIGQRMKSALISAIYRKALKLSSSARKEKTTGEIVNLMSVDAQRFSDVLTHLNQLWSAPLQIALAIYFLWQKLGPSVLAGLAVMVVMIPINSWIANHVKMLQIKQMKYKDERVKLMNEILSGIKVLKLYGWEPSFEQQILKIRTKEVNILRKAAYFNASTSFIMSCAPFVVSLVTFAVYVMVDERNVLDAKTAFVSLSLFNLLKFPLSMLPMMISNIIQASVALKRISQFMNSDELDPSSVNHSEKEEDALVMENCTFKWSAKDPPTLNNINLRIKPKSLVAIVGAVGTGKSSLLSAFLGEMEKSFGYVNTKGSVAYVPQVAWIQNMTLQDNILYGKPMNKKRYGKVIEACALKQDLEMLPGGDQTEIGENGINLSGGQKQRVSLARAVYYDSDIYYLDDPLSAVDSHVGKHIFESVIGPKGILHDKTRVFVTHGITYLPQADLIIVLKDGSISETGTYVELLAKKGAFAEFLTTHLLEVGSEELDVIDDELKKQLMDEIPELERQISRQKSVVSESSDSKSLTRQVSTVSIKPMKNGLPIKNKRLTETEKAQVGGVKWTVYFHYFKSIGLSLAIMAFFLNITYQGFSIGSNMWLSVWSSDTNMVVNGTVDKGKRDMYLGVYGFLGIGQVCVIIVTNITLALGCIRAAVYIHSFLVQRILRAPLSFFDTTPLGRIVNRCASDIFMVDVILPMTVKMILGNSLSVLGTLAVISYSTPTFSIVIVPIGFLYFAIRRFYVATSRQLKRLESISRSPIYSHFRETVTGSSVIRAFNENIRFVKESEKTVDLNQVCIFPGLVATRWLAVRLEMLGNCIIFFAALFSVIGRDTLTAGMVGLSVSYALQITGTLNWLVRMSAELETNIVAVERIKEYEETPQEAPWEKTPSIVGPNWPEEGKVEFRDFKVRYREGLDLVLKGINLTIKGGEKIGIVGRTGAGKSSLTLGLFRIIEAAGGSILIDGVDLSKLGLHVVRSRITIIPQDPVLFSGTLRMNLDPFETYTDDQVWRALELAHLKNYVSGLPAKLQHIVSEGGDNLSVGQRQLICLARALLRKTKVLVLDEATAAVDLETDDLIQRTIRTEFAACTVLTIAHRINTIMDSNRVLVLSDGVVIEFDAPEILLRNKTSAFYSMAKDAGLVS